jgi:hypothetical protein
MAPPPSRREKCDCDCSTRFFALQRSGPAPHVASVLRQYELVEKVRSYDPDADEALINRAYVFSMRAHGSQKRASGDP